MAMVSSEYDTSTPNKENPSVSSVGEMENLGSEGSRTRSDAENSEKVIDQKTVVRRRMTEREKYRIFCDIEYQDEAKHFATKHLPNMCVLSFRKIDRKLSKKRRRTEMCVSTYQQRPWNVTAELTEWEKKAVAGAMGGMPTVLLLVGPPKTGKMEWAMSFGRPVKMIGMWNIDALTDDFTHLVLKNIRWREFPYSNEVLGCQGSFIAGGKYKKKRMIRFGRPVVVTCNNDNDPRKDKRVGGLFKGPGVMVIEVPKSLL